MTAKSTSTGPSSLAKPLLILGANGMLGRALVHAFAAMEPVAWDQAELDITDAAAVTQKLTALKPGMIINAAAYTAVDRAEVERDQAFAVNATGVANLAAAAKNIGATIVHYSTDYVFPGTNEAGYEENDLPGPAVNVYGESKLAGEEALKQSGAAFYLIRTAWLYGAGGKNFVDTMLTLAATKKELSVVNDQHGSPTYVVDLAQATKELVTQYEPAMYHLVNDGVTTWYDFAVEIFRLTGKSVKIAPIPSESYKLEAMRPKYSILKNTQGPRLRPWQEAIDKYLKLV
jgi:dTDP-4-dehydrorhamnose reductase